MPQVVLAGVLQAAAALALLALALQADAPRALAWRVLLGFLGWAALSLFWSVDLGETAFVVMGWLGQGALVASAPKGALLGRTVSAVLLFCALVALRQWWSGFDQVSDILLESNETVRQFAQQWAERKRVFGPFASPDSLAGYLACLVPMAGALALASTLRTDQWIGVVAAALGAVALFLTQSMGGVLSFGAAILLCVGMRLWSERKFHILMALVGTVLVGTAVIFGLRRVDPSSSAWVSAHERWQDWQNALHLAGNGPWWGVGAGAFESAFNAWSPQGRRYSGYAHASLPQLLVELGIPGFLLAATCYLAASWWALKQARRGTWAETLAASGVLAGCMHQQLDYDLHVPAGMGLALAVAGLRAHVTRETMEPLSRGLAGGALLTALAGIYLAFGAGLVERAVPRLPDDSAQLASGQQGAALLWFDARAQVSFAEDLGLTAARAGYEEARELWGWHERAARQSAELAPMLPAGPMILARARASRGDLEGALSAYNDAIARACCSSRLHEERLMVANVLGRTDLVEADKAWLERVR
jgi:O-antigen ligase